MFWELVSASFASFENKVFVVVFLLEIIIRRHVVVDGGVVVAWVVVEEWLVKLCAGVV